MTYTRIAILALSLGCWNPAAARDPGKDADTLYQVSTLDALLAGDYDGRSDYRSVMRHGDFGLGTFEALDGEMVAVDGQYYQVRHDGIATPVSPDQQTPFAAVTWFRADYAFHVSGETSCSDFHRLLEQRLPSDRQPYAIKVTGRFASLTTRSEAAQEKPYPPLAAALEQQVVFDFQQVDAVLAGFWLPPVLADLNVAGFHFHAIMTDTMTGGHVLDCVVEDVDVEIDATGNLGVQLSGGNTQRPRFSVPGRGTQKRRLPLLHW